jgi:nitrogen fixation protein NifU and related proteins
MPHESFINHFRNPRHAGELPPPARRTEVSNPACGDILVLWTREASGRLEEVRFQVRGCPAAIAAGSVLAEWLTGRSLDDLPSFDATLIDRELGGLPASQKHAAALCADGVKALQRAFA